MVADRPMSVVSEEKQLPRVSSRFELEKNIIKILLIHGHEEVVFEEPILKTDDKTGDLKMVTSKMKARVFEKIYLDLQQDEIDFSTTAFKALYPKILLALNEQGVIKMDTFMASLPPELEANLLEYG